MRKLANVLLVISSVLIFTGILFRTMHWPGGSLSLVFGSSTSLIGMLFYFIARYRNKGNVKVVTYSVYFYFFVMVIGTGYYSAINASKDLLNTFHYINTKLERSNEGLFKLILSEEKTKGIEVYNKIEHHKLALISGGSIFNNESKEEVEMHYCDQNGIPLNKDNLDISAWYFLVQENGKAGFELESDLKELRASYSAFLELDNSLLFDPIEEKFSMDGFTLSWIKELCEHEPMISVLSKLTIIQNQILHCELAIQK